jgi:hypothetical protein
MNSRRENHSFSFTAMNPESFGSSVSIERVPKRKEEDGKISETE